MDGNTVTAITRKIAQHKHWSIALEYLPSRKPAYALEKQDCEQDVIRKAVAFESNAGEYPERRALLGELATSFARYLSID